MINHLEHWIDDIHMQAIAGENNLAETAFVVPTDKAGSYVGSLLHMILYPDTSHLISELTKIR